MLTMVEEAVRADEMSIIHDTLKLFSRPGPVLNTEIEFGEDHSGFPAVWEWLIVPETLALEGPEWDSVVEYCDKVDTLLVQKRMAHWPYVSVRSRSQPAA